MITLLLFTGHRWV